ncbi:MAG: hypothetical protein ABIR62_14070 [Dokdonella sp.]|uniref:hypothetical protein n=1 Tax=Dokdonella sp. TaxID=2291710 RepID=UPI003262E2A4
MKAAIFFAVAMALPCSNPADAAITLDLSSVDHHSRAYERFKHYVDGALTHRNDLPYGFSAMDAAYMARLDGVATYCGLAVDLVQTQVDAATSAIAAGKAPEVASDSYLNIGSMIGDLAITYDTCASAMTPQQRTTWSAYAERAVSNVWNHYGATWGGHLFPWTGWSTTDPGNNYYYSFVEATMLWAFASDNGKWMTLLTSDKLPALQAYMATLPGGGSREGTGYGTSHMRLFQIYSWWRDSTKQDLGAANPHLTDSIAYWIHATVPTLDAFAPYGDQSRSSQPLLYDYHRRLMLEARQLTTSEQARKAASWWLNAISIQEMTSSFNFRFDLLPAGIKGTPPDELTYRATGVGELFSRTGWDPHATWFSLIAGPYDQSHAHQEQGGFMLYRDRWLAVTENIWSHSGIQQSSEMNNVVRFSRNGKTLPQRQPNGATMTVTKAAPSGEVHASADLGKVFGSSAVRFWQRDVDFVAGTLTVHDRYAVASDVDAVFQINVPVKPVIRANHVSAGDLQIDVLSPTDATIRIVDWKFQDNDFTSGYRVDVQGRGTEFVVRMTTAVKP